VVVFKYGARKKKKEKEKKKMSGRE